MLAAQQADNIRRRALLATLASAHPANEADNPLRGLRLIRRPVRRTLRYAALRSGATCGRAGSARGMACRPSRSTARRKISPVGLWPHFRVPSTRLFDPADRHLSLVSLCLLGVQYHPGARPGSSRRGGHPVWIQVGIHPDRLGSTLDTYAVPGEAWHAGVTCTLRVPGGFRPFLPRARANRSRVAVRVGYHRAARILNLWAASAKG